MTNSLKVSAQHLKRDAYLYVRQSTLRQVMENTESTRRQYALRDRAMALGWPADRIVVIDSDLGQSGASTVDREGFQRLVTEVGMGRVGIVLGLEVSRLARNCSDWHRLLEICALSGTLILDEDGLYDPRQFNDRLLLGLKGTMSEAELHVLRARLQGGVLNKARRAELRLRLPVGLTYDLVGKVVLDPDSQVQCIIAAVFRGFRETGSARKVVRFLLKQGLKFPTVEWRNGADKGVISWGMPTFSKVMSVLKNPRYAGVYCFGRKREHVRPDGKSVVSYVPVEDWHVMIPEAHEGYLSWEDFQDTQRRLRENYTGDTGRPVREGAALLQGLVFCGVCGRRMCVRYESRAGGPPLPTYRCNGNQIKSCQNVAGTSVDASISELLLQAVTPMAIQATLTIQEELQSRAAATERLHWQQVERAQQEADLARRRYMQVDPDNRLVADSLEAIWNCKLQALQEAQRHFETYQKTERSAVTEEQRQAALSLGANFAAVWRNPAIPHRERKRIVRLLIEDVTLTKTDYVTASIRFKGGATKILTIPIRLPGWQKRLTDQKVIDLIDTLLNDKSYRQIAHELNQRGYRSGTDKPFSGAMVQSLTRLYSLRTRCERLREQGYLADGQMAELLNIELEDLRNMRLTGQIRPFCADYRGGYIYDPTGFGKKTSPTKLVELNSRSAV